MENIDMFFIVGCGFVLLLVALWIRYIVVYRRDIQYVKIEIDRADSWDEYVYWKHELFDIRMSIIPVFTPQRVRRIREHFYYRVYKRSQEKPDGIVSLIMPSVLIICVCVVCLMGGTFAWYSDVQSVTTQAIKTANYDVDISVIKTILKDDEVVEIPVECQNDVYVLEGTCYVTLTATGNASSGYCVLNLDNNTVLHTVRFPNADNTDKSITFTINAEKTTNMTIVPQLGSSSKSYDDKIANGDEYTFN